MFLRRLALVFAVSACAPVVLQAQSVTESLASLHGVTQTNIMATAQLADAELLAFRPTPEVRSTAQLLGHIANAQYAFCSAAAGESNPQTENFEETRTTKAGIIEALEMGFSYCEGVYDAMTDEAGARPVQFIGPSTAHGVLAFNSAHNYEHYGNLVTYMRMNGIVPPSSR
ncbi:MAG: DinB family protein [Longimicrobiales bacterium]|nr:DinB family protein [Longimicrobiales bacterium]